MSEITFLNTLQTVVRKAFDPETISVTVGTVNDAARRFKVVVRDEISKLDYTFHVNLDHTLVDIENFIKAAATKLGLVAGPDKIGDEIQPPVDHPIEDGGL